jgi:hypothetical protein
MSAHEACPHCGKHQNVYDAFVNVGDYCHEFAFDCSACGKRIYVEVEAVPEFAMFTDDPNTRRRLRLERLAPIAAGERSGGDEERGRQGDMTHASRGKMSLLPAAPGKCQFCAVAHAADQPHNQQSLFYQVQFLGRFGRSPTWADAVAHCDEPTRAAWREQLVLRGAWSEPPASEEPIEQKPRLEYFSDVAGRKGTTDERGYKEIPVAEARRIAEECGKHMVVILAYDRHHERTHCTTYGVEPAEKLVAADAGERCAKLLGGDLSAARCYEDFRAVEASKWAALVERLLRACREADDLLRVVGAQRMLLARRPADFDKSVTITRASLRALILECEAIGRIGTTDERE